jgi:hypothetical protein
VNKLNLPKAVISECGKYRYFLSRELVKSEIFKPVTFVMLNPSTADDKDDDPTIRRCIDFAKKFGGTHLIVVNLFALRATDPKELLMGEPVGPENNMHLENAIKATFHNQGVIICAWGNHGSYMERADEVFWNILEDNEPKCLKINKSGHPAHPLYLAKNLKLIDFIN